MAVVDFALIRLVAGRHAGNLHVADADVAGLIIGTLVKEVRLSRDEGGVCGVDMLLPARTHGC